MGHYIAIMHALRSSTTGCLNVIDPLAHAPSSQHIKYLPWMSVTVMLLAPQQAEMAQRYEDGLRKAIAHNKMITKCDALQAWIAVHRVRVLQALAA